MARTDGTVDKGRAEYRKNCIGYRPFLQKGQSQRNLWLEPPPPKQNSARKRAELHWEIWGNSLVGAVRRPLGFVQNGLLSESGAETQARTGDLFLFREALYQLSYLGNWYAQAYQKSVLKSTRLFLVWHLYTLR